METEAIQYEKPESWLEQVLWDNLKEGDEIFIIDYSLRESEYYSGPHTILNKDLRTLAEFGTGKMFMCFSDLLFQKKE
jgi:hypothetical protein